MGVLAGCTRRVASQPHVGVWVGIQARQTASWAWGTTAAAGPGRVLVLGGGCTRQGGWSGAVGCVVGGGGAWRAGCVCVCVCVGEGMHTREGGRVAGGGR